MKKRVIGLGGVFFKSKDPAKTKQWYQDHLGIESDTYGSKFLWKSANDEVEGTKITAWSPMAQDTDYYEPSKREFMINYRVHDLEGLLKDLKEEGVEIAGEMQTYEYGKFAWIMDPDGTKVELWEPIDETIIDGPAISSE
jgi:predicted enzyme related to lactoylglutathione lyase